ncbi:MULTISPECIES: hypothetical protein [Halomonas]|uniref:hypothetical protein n=1 Tax=Halomonas TaxID=2745 RepID=UPI003CF1CE2D
MSGSESDAQRDFPCTGIRLNDEAGATEYGLETHDFMLLDSFGVESDSPSMGKGKTCCLTVKNVSTDDDLYCINLSIKNGELVISVLDASYFNLLGDMTVGHSRTVLGAPCINDLFPVINEFGTCTTQVVMHHDSVKRLRELRVDRLIKAWGIKPFREDFTEVSENEWLQTISLNSSCPLGGESQAVYMLTLLFFPNSSLIEKVTVVHSTTGAKVDIEALQADRLGASATLHDINTDSAGADTEIPSIKALYDHYQATSSSEEVLCP